MADDVVILRAQLDRLESARFRGVRSVRFENRQVDYRSDAEMQSAIATLRGQIAALEGSTSSGNVIVRANKGWA